MRNFRSSPPFPALLVFLAAFSALSVQAQAPCAHDGDCASGEICARGVGPRLGLADADVCIVPRSLAPPAYEVLDFRTLTDDAGEAFDAVMALDLNDSGQVTGTVEGGAGGSAGAAFRYSPADGLELLVPPGATGSAGVMINRHGHVLGRIASGEGLFIHRSMDPQGPPHGFEFLDKGSNRPLRRWLQPLSFNDEGDVLGIFPLPDFTLVPHLYEAGDGWVNLWGRFPSLKGQSLFPDALNNAGDFMILSLTGQTYLVRGALHLSTLPPTVVPLAIGESRRLVGSHFYRGGFQPFFADLDNVPVTLAPARFAGGNAVDVTSDGVVVGLYQRVLPQTPRGSDVVFTFDERRPQRLKVIARRADFAGLVPDGLTFHSVQIASANDRLEMVGTVQYFDPAAADDAIQLESRPFFFSPAFGALALEDLAVGADLPDGALLNAAAINNRGQLLVGISEPPGDGPPIFLFAGSLLLTPAP